jgi:AcrR family transcriptional regulator
MGRRSIHTPEQLRQLILDAAAAIIEAHGLAGLSAREIARRIGYSPGTIYNMFENLDDVVLNVEGRVLDALDERLAAELAMGGDEKTLVMRLAQAYLSFTHQRPKPGGTDTPPWYQEKLERLMGRVEAAVAPIYPPDAVLERQRAARVLWAGVHGITSLSTANKLSNVTTEAAALLVADLINNYLAGVAANMTSAKAAS